MAGDDEEGDLRLLVPRSSLTPTEIGHLKAIIAELSRPEAHDPKLAAEKGVTADGVSLSVTEGRFTPAPLLLPDFR